MLLKGVNPQDAILPAGGLNINAPQLRFVSPHHMPHAKHMYYRDQGSILQSATRKLSHIHASPDK